jgi:hypothetical protein
MDDEGIIRVVLTIVAGVVLLAVVIALPIVWHTNSAAYNSVVVQTAQTQACRSLPTAERAACLQQANAPAIVRACTNAMYPLASSGTAALNSTDMAQINTCVTNAQAKISK